MQTGHSYIPQGRIRSYRFGFNGQEKLNEQYGEGNAYDFGARIYDPRIGRWWATDPLQSKYASFSPYSYAINSPIMAKDSEGKDVIIVVQAATTPGNVGHLMIVVSTYAEVEVNGQKLYYKKGFVIIQNGGSVSYTDLEFKYTGGTNEKEALINQGWDIVAAYNVEPTPNGKQGSAISPDLGANTTYYTKEDIALDESIAQWGITERNKNAEYSHGDGTDLSKQNDCSSLAGKCINEFKLLKGQNAQKDFGITSVNVDGKKYSAYTVNKIGLDLQDLGIKNEAPSSQDLPNMTRENDKSYMENTIKGGADRHGVNFDDD